MQCPDFTWMRRQIAKHGLAWSGTVLKELHHLAFFLSFFLQVDFPSHAFDIEYKIPQAAKTTVHHSIETLEKPLRERLLAILSKDSTLGYVHLFIAIVSLYRTICG